MNIQFKPMPWLSGIVAVMLAILIALGVWQYQRLQWKTDLLAEVEASVTAAPLISLADLERAITAGEPVDFRRISFSADTVPNAQNYHVFKSQSGGIFWDVFVPLTQAGKIIFVSTDTLESDEKKTANDFAPQVMDANIVGYVREDHPMGTIEAKVKSQPNRDTNRWFKFNQDSSWGEDFVGKDVMLSHYIEADPAATSAADLPIRRPSIRNNHRDYMLTWFSFAGLLIIFYLLIHKRAGRLSW